MHLFAGAGGGLLADLIVGHTPVCAVEWDAHACAVLRERSAEGWFPGLHVHEGDVRAFDFRPWARRVDQLSAGFPCQDISAAGRGAGIDGSRSGLVAEVFRAIDEIKPPIVFLENSPNIRTKGRNVIVRKLVARGYSWRDGTLDAADVGAGHQRRRWWLLAANADGMRKLQSQRRLGELWRWASDRFEAPGPDNYGEQCGQAQRDGYLRQRVAETSGIHCTASDPMRGGGKTGCSSGFELLAGEQQGDAAPDSLGASADPMREGSQEFRWPDADGKREDTSSIGAEAQAADRLRNRLQSAVQRGGLSETDAATVEAAARYVGAYDWSPPDAGVCRVVDELASRMDRIKCCGNGQVPLQAAAAYLMLAGL